MSDGKLFMVATPIGNLEDITRRALEVLSQVNVVAAEDTRRTRVLLSRHGLDRPLVALHEHNEEQQAPKLVKRLHNGESVALVSDAGTPLLSDPGYRLLRMAVDAGIEAVPIPGPSSITAALSVSGMPTDRFSFEGFLPPKRAARLKKLISLADEQRTLVLFESSHRIRESLADLEEVLGANRQLAFCRELTKQFETTLRGSVRDIRRQIDEDDNQCRGEIVLVVSGCEKRRSDGYKDALELARELQGHLGASQAARVAAKIHGISRREIYQALA